MRSDIHVCFIVTLLIPTRARASRPFGSVGVVCVCVRVCEWENKQQTTKITSYNTAVTPPHPPSLVGCFPTLVVLTLGTAAPRTVPITAK